MADKAKENLNIEAGAAGMVNKIQKDFEIGTSKLSDAEKKEAVQKAADLAKIEKENFEIKTNKEIGKVKIINETNNQIPKEENDAINQFSAKGGANPEKGNAAKDVWKRIDEAKKTNKFREFIFGDMLGFK